MYDFTQPGSRGNTKKGPPTKKKARKLKESKERQRKALLHPKPSRYDPKEDAILKPHWLN